MSKSTKSPVKPEDIAIRVSNVSKTFKLPHEKHNSIKGLFLSIFKGRRTFEKQQVLDDISFEIKKGEFFGVVGRNGSGKSTLLKLMAGIYAPDTGHIQVNGKLTPFIELGVGFNPELSGRDNVFLNGALLGFSRKEMEAMYDEIVEFAELEQFMDQKLKNYSSGMQVRLAFSIAIRANTDILVLDEVLAVGDEAFQRKCFEYFAQLKQEKKTVVLVTHSMDSVQRFCTKAMLINDGEIRLIGSPDKVSREYEELNLPLENEGNYNSIKRVKANDVRLEIKIKNENNKPVKYFLPDDKNIKLDLGFESVIDLDDIFIGVVIQKMEGEQVFWTTTEDTVPYLQSLEKNKPKRITLHIQNIFGEGDYLVNVSVKNRDRTKDHLMIYGAAKFSITGYRKNGWMLHPNHKFTH